ncbi:unnamed protein product, partial [Iphiclides podalirius]
MSLSAGASGVNDPCAVPTADGRSHERSRGALRFAARLMARPTAQLRTRARVGRVDQWVPLGACHVVDAVSDLSEYTGAFANAAHPQGPHRARRVDRAVPFRYACDNYAFVAVVCGVAASGRCKGAPGSESL